MALSAWADPVESGQAKTVAAAYVSRNYAPSVLAKAVCRLAAPSTLTVTACRPLKGAGGVIGYVAELAPSGFVVVRADSDLPPLKLHAPTGMYEGLPAGFRAVVEAELAGELADLDGLRKAHHATDSRHRDEWQALTQTAALDSLDLSLAASGLLSEAAAGTILLTTAWDQVRPYNYYAPAASGGTDGKASIGCGPVAMAQILRYHKKPARPVSDFSYTDEQGSCVGTHALSDAGGLGDYDWAHMPASVTDASPLAERQAVGRLTYHCAVAMEADFEGANTSVISFFTAARMLRGTFGYTCEELQSRADFSASVWFARIQADVDASRPIYYTMVSTLGGHATVCDGYRNGSEIHLSFGLSGYGDAWYNIDSVVFPNYKWSWHEAVFGIAPDNTPVPNTLTVVAGTGAGQYFAGAEVIVAADESAEGYRFSKWSVTPAETELGEAFSATQTVTTVVMPNYSVTLTAVFKPFNVNPVVTYRSPADEVLTISEGSALSLRVAASDSLDPDTEERGMASVVWLVDGVLTQTTQTGAPNTISSTLSYRPGTNTVLGAASRDILIRAVASDRQGGTSETHWVVRVLNAAASQTITFNAVPTMALGVTDFDLGATASSGLPVAYASSDEAVAQVVGGLIQIGRAGTTTITASQPGDADFKAAASVRRTLTVRARLTAEVTSGGGTVTGAGLYKPGVRVTLKARPAGGYAFLRWEDGVQTTSRSLVMPDSNVTVRAWFGLTADVPPPLVADPGPQQAMVGVFFSLPLDVQSDTLPAVSVSGLPAGLRYNATRGAIEGAPTAVAASKTVAVSVKNVNAAAAGQTFNIAVAPLPLWAQGAFSGTCLLGEGGESAAEMTVTAQGKITGKFSCRGTNYTFSAKSYTNGEGFVFASVASAGKVKVPLALSVAQPESGADGPADLSVAEGQTSYGEADALTFRLYRHVWKDADMAGVSTNYAGYYTAILPCGLEAGTGYLTLTVNESGAVKTAGKLADGTAVSLSGTLLADESGRVFVALYSAPSTYKGGCFFAWVEFVASDAGVMTLLPAGTFRWVSLNPLATGEHGAGFERELSLSGGWYDKVGNLYRYYADAALTVGGTSLNVPAVAVGTNRYDSVWWSPYAVTLTPATNRAGLLTGFAAPTAERPVKADRGYDYAGAANAISLRMTLVRSTGIFKGSFKAWFDYGTTHTSRTITYQGVLVPESQETDSGIEGGGFFLWADKASYLNPAGKTASYSFSWSYSFLLAREPEAE